MSFQRLNFEEGLDLFQNADLFDLQKMAVEQRNKINPVSEVTYVIDSNPNYTNACTADCLFCAFYRKPGDEEVYVRSLDDVRNMMKDAQAQDATTVLLQGGLHPDLKLDYYLDIIKMTVAEFPGIIPHFWSAPEIDNIAEVENITVREVLQKMYDVGQLSLPGGGAEILSQKVRNRISPKKHKVDRWLHIHEVAHEIGMKSTATMMYGHREEPEDIIIHLQAIRDIQDRTGGFTAFVPWTYKKDNTLLGKKVTRETTPEDYYRILAISRLYLDNFDHIQASWFSEGKDTGVKSLSYGADDFGGTLFEENVHAETGFINKTSAEGLCSMIRKAGFTPVQRDTLYNKVLTVKS
ncbi:dehypoxanthine futalosine cyclase [Lentisphaera profundi]|uniref:Cyclic dehypoxanthine futalosine synthase n=1 Tax=Lentisphaera profundi TaxID=1658616 RepID=A0ABY7VRE7_9BACT|nr:cyclic dehypoxanthinyl futalosine synthase [Lentisphaera profundi]WDE95364.1 dehypoxanthine futalosine cyclase [Lentisphaera profundi]